MFDRCCSDPERTNSAAREGLPNSENFITHYDDTPVYPRDFLASCLRSLLPGASLRRGGLPQKILVLFWTFFEIQAILAFLINRRGGRESAVGMEGRARVRGKLRLATPLAG